MLNYSNKKIITPQKTYFYESDKDNVYIFNYNTLFV
jgi:hypothetical protein